MPRRFRALGLIAAVAVWFVTAAATAAAQSNSAQDYFRGKSIRLEIPTGPGGAYGLYALLFAEHFGRHVPGSPTIVPEYRAGAGGIISANYLYTLAPRDGTVIGIPLAPIILGQYTGGSAVRYDASKFQWIGQMSDITRLLTVWANSNIHSFADLRKYGSVAGTTGRGSETFINPAIINHVFGTKIKIVGGYKGSSDLLIALERGEINLMSATWSNLEGNRPDWVKHGKVRLLVQIGLSKVPGLDNVPLLVDLAGNDADRQLLEFMSLVTTSVGYSVMAPPGVPNDIVKTLRGAFDATMKDPAFIADARNRHIELAPADYRSVDAAVAKAIHSSPALFTRFERAIGSQ
jgi:tripartite-type tricarboxylate transporter receptor subunit TctC